MCASTQFVPFLFPWDTAGMPLMSRTESTARNGEKPVFDVNSSEPFYFYVFFQACSFHKLLEA